MRWIYLLIVGAMLSSLSGDEKKSIGAFFVGELQEEWEFGSDHMPVGVQVGGFACGCWNILDSDYLSWIEKNGQGLKNSAIMRDNTHFYSSLTIRELKILNQVLHLLSHPEHPFAILALEEVSPKFYEMLSKAVPAHIAIVVCDDFVRGDIFLYDKSQFILKKSHWLCYSASKHTMSCILLEDKRGGQLFNCFQSHMPGGPANEGARQEFAQFILKHVVLDQITLILGDHNCTSDCFMEDLQKVAGQRSWPSCPFVSLQIPYPTCITPSKEACWIDNIFVHLPEGCPFKVFGQPSDFFEQMAVPIEAMWKHFFFAKEIEEAGRCFGDFVQWDSEMMQLFENHITEWRLQYLRDPQFDIVSVLKVLVESVRENEKS